LRIQEVLKLIDEARENGVRLEPACQVLNISSRTYQRWKKEGPETADKRPLFGRKSPKNKLTQEEKKEIIRVCNSKEYVDLPPAQIVPKLADQGIYIASESSFYRVLKEEQQHTKRRSVRKPHPRPLSTHIAEGPNQVWSWDITWLPAQIAGHYFKLYLIIDIFNRYIVGWEVP
jgi:putative transposase